MSKFLQVSCNSHRIGLKKPNCPGPEVEPFINFRPPNPLVIGPTNGDSTQAVRGATRRRRPRPFMPLCLRMRTASISGHFILAGEFRWNGNGELRINRRRKPPSSWFPNTCRGLRGSLRLQLLVKLGQSTHQKLDRAGQNKTIMLIYVSVGQTGKYCGYWTWYKSSR